MASKDNQQDLSQPNEHGLVQRPDPNTQIVLAPPRAAAGRISEFHVLEYTPVRIDQSSDTYPIDGGRALLKPALMRIAAAAGISVIESGPIGQPTPDYLMWRVRAALPLGDGQVVESTMSYEWDAKVILNRYNKDTKKLERVPVAEEHKLRQFRVMLAESKALNRCVRALLGVKSKYAAAELSKPFIVPRVRYQPDLSNPDVREVVIARGAVAAKSLYGGGGGAAALPAADDLDPSTMPVVPDEDEAEYEVLPAEGAAFDAEFDDGGEVMTAGDYVVTAEGSTFKGRTLDSIESEKPGYCVFIVKKRSGIANAELFNACLAYAKEHSPEAVEGIEYRDLEGGE